MDSCKLQELYESQTSKIVAHNERLLNDLQREVKTNETLRMQLHECKMQNEKLRQRVTEVEEKLENYESQHPKLACLGGEKWKAQAVARLYEDKLAVAEKNIQQKTKVIEELKNLLNEAILMEDQFLKSRGRLQQVDKNFFLKFVVYRLRLSIKVVILSHFKRYLYRQAKNSQQLKVAINGCVTSN